MMNLGAFSVSLSVNNLKASKDFYEKLGFSVFSGSMEQNYLIMKNSSTLIGLFEGMFDDNLLTFNPGWDQDANTLDEFQDVREIQQEVINKGIELVKQANESAEGPGSFVIKDPDGNLLLIDQHVT